MNNMRDVRVFSESAEVIEASASHFVDEARKSFAERGMFRVVLAGGSTPRKLYELLCDVRAPFRNQLDWSRIQWFWGDERAVAPTHTDSNFRLANEAMLSRMQVNPGLIFRMEAEGPVPDLNARSYEARIRSVFGIERSGEFPVFDYVWLGLGSDGHTASLFPGTSAIAESSRWVVANHTAKLSAYRLTLTLPVLNNARHISLLALGAEKLGVVQDVLDSTPGVQENQSYPIQRVMPVAGGRMIWWLDRAARGRDY